MRAGASVRSPRPWLTTTVLCVHAALLAWLWLAPHPWIDAAHIASRGLIEFTLAAGLSAFVVIVVLVIRVWGRVPFAAIGLSTRGLGTAIVATVTLWLSVQVVSLLALVVGGVPFELGVTERTSAEAAGALIAQLAGNALFEEAVYRGYLVPRAVDLARMRWRPLPALVIGIAGSQLVFALKHIPQRLDAGVVGVELVGHLAMLWCVGVAMTLLYARTRNLWLAVGTHALLNTPTILFDPQG